MPQKLKTQKILKIIELAKKGKSYGEIAEEVGVSRSTAYYYAKKFLQ